MDVVHGHKKGSAGQTVDGVAPELGGLLAAVREHLVTSPVDVSPLCDSLESLLEFLASKAGRTHENCLATDLYFTEWRDWSADPESLPEGLQLIIDDVGMGLHDTFNAPEVATNFESTPEQLLARLRAFDRGSSGT